MPIKLSRKPAAADDTLLPHQILLLEDITAKLVSMGCTWAYCPLTTYFVSGSR